MSLGVKNPVFEVQFLVWSGMLAHYVSCFTLNNKVTPFNPGSLENVVLLNCITPKSYAKDTTYDWGSLGQKMSGNRF